nr:MAG TPA: PORTAL PROTEIN [Caudoviricetes sp.]
MIVSNDELTLEKIIDILQTFRTSEQPRLEKLERYYLGKHAILMRQMADDTQPNNKVVINYPSLICDSYASYLVGTPIVYNGDEQLASVLNYNDVADEDLEIATDANIFGFAIEQLYLDEDGQIRFTRVSPKETILICDNSIQHNITAAIKFFPIDDYTFAVEVYDKEKVSIYTASTGLSELHLTEERPHYFKDVPFVEYINNEYRQSSFEQVMGLIDGLEKLASDEVNTFEQFCDCYMILKNVVAEAEDIQQMKQNRVLLLDSDSDASYLTKQVNIEQITSLKNEFVKNIHKISCVPDMSDENFANNASGVAIRYKILAFENQTAKKERKFKKGLQRRLELINNILSITGKAYLDTQIIFTRNLPVNELEIAQEVNMLRGLVSNKTLLAQLPFVDDIETELEQIQEETEQTASLYSFGSVANE